NYNCTSISSRMLTYDGNGGLVNVDTVIFDIDDTITISNNIPTLKKHTFLGWALTSDATEALYQPGDEITPAGNLTLYAVWEEIPGPDTATTPSIVSGHIVLFVEAKETITTDKMLHIALYSENSRMI
ncbi:MAG: InlB B-repeat-containing protein, partial [Clostridia bacterium]|nr:InlB B-repeat-containing protein [Clostridia bacterium]